MIGYFVRDQYHQRIPITRGRTPPHHFIPYIPLGLSSVLVQGINSSINKLERQKRLLCFPGVCCGEDDRIFSDPEENESRAEEKRETSSQVIVNDVEVRLEDGGDVKARGGRIVQGCDSNTEPPSW